MITVRRKSKYKWAVSFHQTPTGQELSSTREDNGTFVLSLSVTGEDQTGSYSCDLVQSLPAVRCLPPDSALLRPALITVDDTDIRLLQLEARQRDIMKQVCVCLHVCAGEEGGGISLDVRIGGQKLETVQSFKYLGSVVTDEGSKQEIMSRIAQTIGALTKLKAIWKDKNIALSSKIRLMGSLVISIFLYACETWTLTAELEKKIQTTEMRCFRRPLGISYRDHVTNEKVGNRIRQAIGPYEDLLTTVKKRKLRWYGHKTRSTGLAKMILQGTVQGGRRRGRQQKRWEDNITEWTGLKLGEALRKAENREEWRQWLPDHPWCTNGQADYGISEVKKK